MNTTKKESSKSRWPITIVSIILTGIVTYFVGLAVANNTPPTEVTGQITVDLVVKEMKENPSFQNEILAEVGAVTKVSETTVPTTMPKMQDEINVFVDAVSKAQDNSAYIDNGTVYLSIDDIAKIFDKPVEWDGSNHTVYFGKRSDIEQYLGEALKPYQSDGIGEYTITGGNSFSMSGVKYYRGILVGDNHSGGVDGWALYNFNNQFSSINGIMGHVDGSGMGGSIVKFFSDGKLIEEFDLDANDMPKPFSVNVAGALQVRIEFTNWEYGTFALADVVIE